MIKTKSLLATVMALKTEFIFMIENAHGHMDRVFMNWANLFKPGSTANELF